MDLNLIIVIGWAFFLLAIGYILPVLNDKSIERVVAWSIVILTTLISVTTTLERTEVIRMIVIVSLQLLSMKVIVMVETYRGKPILKFFQWIVFAQGWFGMRPRLFEKFISKPLSGIKYFILKGVSRIVLGIILLTLSKLIEEHTTKIYFLADLLMLAGISLILHFGILNLSTAIWRFFGVDVKELFRSPIKAKSLQEFWGKRWNLAFSEMTALVVYKPLKGNLGQTKAMMISFLASGVLHEIAISFPVDSGYGLPLLYFLFHAIAMMAEDKLPFVKRLLMHHVFSRIWVLGWLLLPMPLLFHSSFMAHVAEPIRNEILRLIIV